MITTLVGAFKTFHQLDMVASTDVRILSFQEKGISV